MRLLVQSSYDLHFAPSGINERQARELSVTNQVAHNVLTRFEAVSADFFSSSVAGFAFARCTSLTASLVSRMRRRSAADESWPASGFGRQSQTLPQLPEPIYSWL